MPPVHDDAFAAWLRSSTAPLDGLDPDAPLDDLEPLQEAVGDARVVAIGESSHFIEEFARARHRILRFLVERCGFTVFAFEYGFSEAFAVDAWTRGTGAEADLDELATATLPVGIHEPLRWLRRHNARAPRPVQFAGVDIPEAGGSLLPALIPVLTYLRETDPAAVPLAERAIGIAERFAAPSMPASAPAWARLGTAGQDALSALLMRLSTRFRAVEPLYVARSGQEAYDLALRRMEGACHTDYTFRAMSELLAGKGLPADASAREVYMAGSVLWHLEHSAPDARIVLAAHNAHIQKAPVAHGGTLSAFPMGQHLHRALGDGYFALGLTSTGGDTAEMRLDENTRFGFAVDPTPLGSPEPGSIEAAFAAAAPGAGLAALRGAPRSSPGPDRIRMQGAYLHTPVLEAFDGMLHVPQSTVFGGLASLGY